MKYCEIIGESFNHNEPGEVSVESLGSHFEIIVIDNSSQDKTLEIVNSYNSKKIKIIPINNEGKISVSRNLGVQNSNGDWISFLEYDDYWHSNKLSFLIQNGVTDGMMLHWN